MHTTVLVIAEHTLGVLLLAFALILDVLTIFRWFRHVKNLDDRPGYGCLPLPVYVIASLLIWNDWRTRIMSALSLMAFHVGYQLVLVSLRLWQEKKTHQSE